MSLKKLLNSHILFIEYSSNDYKFAKWFYSINLWKNDDDYLYIHNL
jgi:hypothetical protein